MRTITIANQKGGTGKSTTASALGAGLRKRGYRVLFVDLDGQGNLSYSMGADCSGSASTGSMEVLTRVISASEAIQHTASGDIIASSPALAGANTSITQVGKEYRLKEALEPLSEAYDFCVVDTPPALGIVTVNALTASQSLIIPATADIYSLQGIGQLSLTLQAVQRYCNPGLRVEGILITSYSSRSIISRDMADSLRETASAMGTKVFDTSIRICSSVREAQTMMEDLYTYAPKSNATKDYDSLIDELLEGWRS